MSAIALGSLVANPAHAAGTASGTVITNNVTVSYSVGTTPQTDATATNNITVDRKVNVTVVRVDNTATSVTPGTLNQAVSFRIENISNATLDFQLDTLQVATGSPAGIAGTDGFNVGSLTYRLDDGDNVLDAGDTTITHLNALAPDTPVVVHVVAASVPLGTANGSIAAVTLTATAKENDNGALVGSNLTQAATNTAGVDTIFADIVAGAIDGVRDGAYSATDDYVVLTATLAATKTSSVVAGDFGTGAAIPGATVEYCISVSNTGGTAASNVAISDTLPGQMTYDAAYGVKVGGANCTTPGAVAGSFASGVVSGTIGTLNTGTTQTVIFRATIN